jgi:hypothetical protein
MKQVGASGANLRKVASRSEAFASGLFWIPLRPAVVAIAIFLPERALAGSAIDAAVKPYFVAGGWLIALVFISIGAFLSSKAISRRRVAAAAEQWPTADGLVISAEIIKRVSKSDDEFDTFIPQVRYAYVVNGARCEANVIQIGLGEQGYIQEQQARDHLSRYPVGTTVSVRYDPGNPRAAVLEIGQVGASRKLFAGAILAAVGLAAIVFAIWSISLPVR